ncbi:polysaccharide pyruvyl transferase [Sediminihabitans luteus]|uniref:Polysaccharide pyruvyl transferase n=1 Tax=Sediminihabitans luteus TaxID=1138585 RepID=A0A2M9CDP8_9CELL|nr:GT-D fold domain-containing glycosyltransferase [Sediminihabitans luteus]PJJ69999.1 polysaccharide pyruvyl transferase [Sediminihabitans luteus]GII99320.1 hypothetical protein Slu03_16980 [Sediminihabitans luteus]
MEQKVAVERLARELERRVGGRPDVAVSSTATSCTVRTGRDDARLTFEIRAAGPSAELTVTAHADVQRRALRNALVGRSRIAAGEVHVLATLPFGDRAAERAAAWVVWTLDAVRATPIDPAGATSRLEPGQVAAYWWDERSNFGDAIGPWLVERISGLRPVNARRRRGLRPALYSVGSIVGYVNRDDVDVWGSGLMEPLAGTKLETLRRRTDVRVRAVRGAATREELVTKLGWDVPEVYGDPALLLPRFYEPREPAAGRARVAFVPHYVHRKHLTGEPADGVRVVDVAQDLETVVDEITAADVCVSTSLHGIVVAQAYGVPWVWLRVADHTLGGDAFKFGDFFSTLDGSDVAQHDVPASGLAGLDLLELAGSARLPGLAVSLDALLEAFPLGRAGGTLAGWEPPSVPRARPELLAPLRRQAGRARRAVGRRVGRPSVVERADANHTDLTAVREAVDRTTKAVEKVARELADQRRALDAIRLAATASTMSEVQAFANARQLTMLETLRHLAQTDDSVARFGDGEFRMMLRSDYDLRFQRNSPELRAALREVLAASGDEGISIGFPQVFRDAHWSGVWAELWPELRPHLPEHGTLLNSHVTRPIAFNLLRDDAVSLWRDVWRDKRVALVTGAGSRFETVPALFSSARSTQLVESLPQHAFDDLDRLVEVVSSGGEFDLALISLGPAGTVLAHRLHRAGVRALDIGHITDSYRNIYDGAPRPEAKPVVRP